MHVFVRIHAMERCDSSCCGHVSTLCAKWFHRTSGKKTCTKKLCMAQFNNNSRHDALMCEGYPDPQICWREQASGQSGNAIFNSTYEIGPSSLSWVWVSPATWAALIETMQDGSIMNAMFLQMLAFMFGLQCSLVYTETISVFFFLVWQAYLESGRALLILCCVSLCGSCGSCLRPSFWLLASQQNSRKIPPKLRLLWL